jgi:hypothetical protein
MIKILRLNESKSEEVISHFKRADRHGSVSVNLDYLGEDWHKNTEDYHLYDNFYLYNNSIFELNTSPSGDWYGSTLSKHKVPPHVFEDEIFEKIQELEKAFNMLD